MKKNKLFPLVSRDRTTLFALLGIGFAVFAVFGLVRRPFDANTSDREAYRFQVDVNDASRTELQILPGIGEKLADGIVRHRETKGSFRIPEDLRKVKGIGPKKLDAVTPHLLEIPVSNGSGD